MARLTPTEIAQIVTMFGFADRVTAVAVVLGESGGDPKAVNREPGNVDRGLWQISSKHHPNVSDAQAFSIEDSTRYALTLSKGGTDFNPWHATRSPNFPQHVATARAAVAAVDGGDRPLSSPSVGDVAREVGDRVGDVAGAVPFVGGLANLGDVIGYAGKALSVITSAEFWRRFGFVLAGVVLVVVGLVAVFGGRAVRTAADVAT